MTAVASGSGNSAKLITIGSASGGCGKTFFATNLGASLARAGQRVVLVDLDLQFGEVAVSLQLRPLNSVIDGFFGKGGRSLPVDRLAADLHELVVRHPSGMDVLTAPRDPAEADLMQEGDIARLFDVLRDRYDVVVVDTAPALNEMTLSALERSDVIVVMASLDVPSLKNLASYLDTLDRLSVDQTTIRLVLNKIDRDVGIDATQAQEIFEGRFVGLIHQDRAVSRALNLGAILIESEPRSRVARQLTDAIEAVLPAELLSAPAGVAEGLDTHVLTRLAQLVRSRAEEPIQEGLL